VDHTAELVEARDAALTVAQDVDRRQVEALTAVLDEILEMPRKVVQPDGAGFAIPSE
jgi:hypothetical protein